MADRFGTDIFIRRTSSEDLITFDKTVLSAFEVASQSHRDDYHFFVIQERGNTIFEIDFQKYKVKGPAIIYIHPGQVHRIVAFENVAASFLAINNESVKPENLNLLQEIAPVKPLLLKNEKFSLFTETVSLCIKFSERTDEQLYHSLLADSCNILIALVISQYLGKSRSIDKFSRFEMITKSFKAILESNFTKAKRPSGYAEILNITTSYLNECLKNTTGHSVSYHIQQRIILEAKRLLYHSDKSVKEIASELGYDDYPYFSRLFAKHTGMSALAFRNKNHD